MIYSLKRFSDMLYGASNREIDELLFVACQDGNEELFQQAVSQGADLNACDIGTRRRPIHIAVVSGNLHIVEKLVNSPGVDLDVADARWWTPLDIAREQRNEDIITLLEAKINKSNGDNGGNQEPNRDNIVHKNQRPSVLEF